jgi:hypothetical protein
MGGPTSSCAAAGIVLETTSVYNFYTKLVIRNMIIIEYVLTVNNMSSLLIVSRVAQSV